MSTAAALLAEATQRLKAAGNPDAARDARRLLAHACAVDASRLTVILQDDVPPDAKARFESFVQARLDHQPVSQIIGRRDFYGRSFKVTRDVLDPRPETETLVELALAEPFDSVLDLGTGSGCVALSLLAERRTATAVATDISTEALCVAEANANTLGLGERVDFAVSDWFAQVDGSFDLIVSNPPYITSAAFETLGPDVRLWEPKQALTPGGDGLAPYRIIAATGKQYLNQNGRILVEIGFDQAHAVRALFADAGFAHISVCRDLDGRDRVVCAQ